jgi:hypothetical protein
MPEMAAVSGLGFGASRGWPQPVGARFWTRRTVVGVQKVGHGWGREHAWDSGGAGSLGWQTEEFSRGA